MKTSFNIKQKIENESETSAIELKRFIKENEQIEIKRYEKGLNNIQQFDRSVKFDRSFNATYFDNFCVEHIPKEIKKFIEISLIKGSTITTNIYRIQACDSVMCGYFCIGFIDFMLKDKSLTGFTNLFSSNNLKKNDDIILNFF